jgi:6-phosphogluconolactonase
MHTRFRVAIALLFATSLGSSAFAQHRYNDDHGAVFVMTNAADKNGIVDFERNEDGSLQARGTFATGGRGSGGTVDPLQSQGSLILDSNNNYLFAVNAGDGTVSSLRIDGNALNLVDVKPSGGTSPVSLAQSGRVLYVLNSGGEANVSGFWVGPNGDLHRIPNSTRFLSGANLGASSISFSPDGRFLVVTERLTNVIDVFRTNPNGTVDALQANKSSGEVPFASVFSPSGALIVVAASNSISSYAIDRDRHLASISASLPTDGAASCWNAITPDGRFVYTSNSASATVSGYAVGKTGTLTPVGATVVGTLPPGSANLDLAISRDGRFLYSLNGATGAVGIFAIQSDGSLTPLGTVDGLPARAGLNGIAAL